jgi:hypothetical protein
MTKYFFFNFTDKPFTGYWNGRAYTFNSGVKKEYIQGIAEHFAKHLANQVLTETGRETYTSPKKPQDVPVFMEVFNKALLTQEIPDEGNLDIKDGIEINQPSMNIEVKPRQMADPYDAKSQPAVGPGTAPQVVGSPVEDDDEEFEGK